MTTDIIRRAARLPKALARRERPDWFDDAACKEQTVLFFPPHGYEDAHARVAREQQAQAICNVCPAMRACRSWARQHREIGYWGAENDEERIAAGYRNNAADASAVRRSRTRPTS